MVSQRNTRVLYTALIGGYEQLNELEVQDETIDKICFTDDRNINSSTWKIVYVDLPFPLDSFRSQRFFKVLGHPELERYDEWLYIDNSVRLTVPPSQVLDIWLSNNDLAIPGHSFRETLQKEFEVVDYLELDSEERIREQLAHYQVLFPSTLEKQPFWCGIIARRKSPEVAKWSAIWWEHILRYSRRDQLSVLAALELSRTEISRISLDNASSNLHQWPIHNSRKEEMRLTNQINYRKSSEQFQEKVEELQGQFEELTSQFEELTSQFDEVTVELHEVLNSISWKITHPLRKIFVWTKAIKPKTSA